MYGKESFEAVFLQCLPVCNAWGKNFLISTRTSCESSGMYSSLPITIIANLYWKEQKKYPRKMAEGVSGLLKLFVASTVKISKYVPNQKRCVAAMDLFEFRGVNS